ncbi:glycosyltransferase [Sulfuriroseicoccus oceanibius]|uniref:Glycosyltransferase n=1 Tax=Sulfuriroseicoccus oceanibius TaxID=2707525 RepID=A0A6B3L8Z1_9BACT|nr:glycosyltransferase [Sulfuriroseicoccus oceanibius]QQL44364.1 glycosyltransferase [Sulfuriroseicoccus oceanibius]
MSKPVVASYCTTFLKPEMLHIYRQVSGLDRYDTFVICKERRSEDRFPFDDVEVKPKVRSNFLRRFWLKYIKKEPPIVYRGEYGVMEKILTRRHADLMHVYFGHTGVHLLPIIQRSPLPVVVSFHGMDVQPRHDQPGYIERLQELLQSVPLLMARSFSLRDRLIELGAPEDRIRINRTGIPMDVFPAVKREYPEDGAWKFIQACRLVEKKGLPVALKAFSEFVKDHPKATFTIAGEGPMEEEVRGIVDKLGLADKVIFAGFLSPSELNALYAESHVFMHPSQITADKNQEGVPNAMLEGMATGLPVLATYHGGIPEAVDHESTGLLVEERDDVGLLEQVRRLTSDRELWQRMGEQAAVSVRERFEQKRQIAALEAIYDEAVALGPMNLGGRK